MATILRIFSRQDGLIEANIKYPKMLVSQLMDQKLNVEITDNRQYFSLDYNIDILKDGAYIPNFQLEDSYNIARELYRNPASIEDREKAWLESKDNAVNQALKLSKVGVQPKMYISLLDPYMNISIKMTGTYQEWKDFFDLNCPRYTFGTLCIPQTYYSKKEAIKVFPESTNEDSVFWMKINKNSESIYIMDLAESIYDAMEEIVAKEKTLYRKISLNVNDIVLDKFPVYSKTLFNAKRPFRIVGIRKNEIELEGDFAKDGHYNGDLNVLG